MSHSTPSRSRHQNDLQWIPLLDVEAPATAHSLPTAAATNQALDLQVNSHEKQIRHTHQSMYNRFLQSANGGGVDAGDGEAQGLLDRGESDIIAHHPTTSNTHASKYCSDSIYHVTQSTPVAIPTASSERPVVLTTWMPYTLRTPFLATTAVIALSLSATLATLCWKSANNHGLGRDDGSSHLLVGWRYVPTIVAVLFAQVLVLIFNDVQRTEPFAQLARISSTDRRHGNVEQALQYKAKVWWKTFVIGFSKRKNGGHRNMVLSFSALVTGLGLLLISALSSSLLASEQVIITTPVDLQRFALNSDNTLPLSARRDTYFHTTSGYTYNASTSMWVTEDHVIFPFEISAGRSDNESSLEGIWEAETTVYQMELECKKMSVDPPGAVNLTYEWGWDNRTYTHYSAGPDNVSYTHNETKNVEYQMLILVADDGCRIQIIDSNEIGSGRSLVDGGVLWTNLSASHVSWKSFTQEMGNLTYVSYDGWSPFSDSPLVEFNEHCIRQELLFVSSPWKKPKWYLQKPSEQWPKDFEMRAEICTSTYYEATISVTAAVSKTSAKATFDQDEFQRRRRPLEHDTLNIDHADHFAFYGVKPNYKSMSKVHGGYSQIAGLTETLVASSRMNSTMLSRDADLVKNATRLRSRFFHELVYSSLTNQDSPNLVNVAGHFTSVERRIVVVTGIAIALAVLTSCAAFYFAFMVISASARRRPLKLRTDPATVVGVADYLLQEGTVILNHIGSPEPIDRYDEYAALAKGYKKPTSWAQKIRNKSCCAAETLAKSEAIEFPPDPRETVCCKRSFMETSHPPDWRPRMLYTRALATLLLVLMAITTALIILRRSAVRGQLYRSAFVYQVRVGNMNAQISPISVTSTLLAVSLALCWDSIDRSLRMIQPYFSLLKASKDTRDGVCLSYQSSYWIWASSKAAVNNHWLLALVTFGTTLSQVCESTISSSFLYAANRSSASLELESLPIQINCHLMLCVLFNSRS